MYYLQQKMFFILRNDQKMISSAKYIKHKSPLSGGRVDFILFSPITQSYNGIVNNSYKQTREKKNRYYFCIIAYCFISISLCFKVTQCYIGNVYILDRFV